MNYISVFALWVLLAFAGASDASPADETLCTIAFGHPNVKFARDVEVENLARQYLRASARFARPVVCIGDNGPNEFAESRMLLDERGPHFLIAFNADFRLALGREVRGIVAHEVAHEVAVGGHYCGRWFAVSKEEYIKCEHNVDKEADHVAGVGEMLNALQFLRAYALRVHGAQSASGKSFGETLGRRIELLTRPSPRF